MFDITVTGDTLDDVVAQMRTFIEGVSPLLPASSPAVALTAASVTKRRARSASVAPAAPAAPIVPAPRTEEEIAAQMPGEDILGGEPAVDLEKLRETALEKLRDLYAKSDAGKKAVADIAKKFGVKKLANVPAEKAVELMAEVEKASAPAGGDDLI